MDAFSSAIQNCQIGKLFVLPSAHIGAPRHLNELYYDAMAIVGKFGKPDLFITMTTNPKWPEIQKNLFKCQNEWDRFDLTCRVFNLKLKQLLKDIKNKNIFGKVNGVVWTIEFQKRGLPHAHILIILDYKINSVNLIDRCVWAEIPDQSKYPKLYEKVLNFMIHSPCDVIKNSPCINDNKVCGRHFPKDRQDSTILDVDSYPIYRRRQLYTINFRKNKKVYPLSDEFVVPYNPYLLSKYNCHINVEVCNSIKAIKYLFKYIYKGNDHAVIQVDEFDEINKYMNSRYVSSVEAFWRIKSFKIHGRSPSVFRLPVHLEDLHNVTFTNDSDLEELLQDKKDTQLTSWFKSNIEYPDFNHLTYYEYPQYFKWDLKSKKWVKRQRSNNIVVRVYAVSPNDINRFYLKLILNHIRGAICYEDLLIVNGHKYDTYREVASIYGLLENDDIWFNTLQEGVNILNSYKCRQLFAYMLIFCEIQEPKKIWNQFKSKLYDDYKRKFPNLNVVELEEKVLIDLNKYLLNHNLNLEDFGLPKLKNKFELDYSIFSRLNDNDIIDYDKNIELLTQEQLSIYDYIKNKLINKSSDNNVIFIDSPGGTGKTFLLNTIIVGMMKEGFKVVSVAYSGIASILLINGRTSHSFFKIPINIKSNQQVFNIEKQSNLAKFIKTIDLIIYDEATMASKTLFESFDKTLRDLCDNDSLFGNKILLLSGDFRQTLPIIKFAKKEEIINSCIKFSYFWNDIKLFRLSKNLRLSNNEVFANVLLKIGEDKIVKNNDNEILLDKNLIHQNNNLDDFLNYFFEEEHFKEGNDDYYIETAILAPLNEDVNTLNIKIMEKFISKNHFVKYYSTDSLSEECQNMNISTEVLNKIDQSGLPSHELILKTGSIIILLRNINPNIGLCNGTRIKITRLYNHIILGKIITGKFKGNEVEITRITIRSDPSCPIKFIRKNFPVRPAFVISINKAQGQTYQKVGIYLKNKIFSHGQLYVALSRCSDYEKIKIFFEEENKITTNNVVYKEIL